jgi:hypothetical protein
MVPAGAGARLANRSEQQETKRQDFIARHYGKSGGQFNLFTSQFCFS